ncbi:M24 family metallopeptidase [Sporobolomyces koalae]|uniref:M24 family metallopeptidase n=1 Tax=Sporobolomyces koalae TaxID=500713 RepID=UPI00316E1213
MEKGYTQPSPVPTTRSRPSLIGTFVLTVLFVLAVFAQLSIVTISLKSSSADAPARLPSDLHPSTAELDRKIDWSWLSHERQCPHLAEISVDEFTARRDRLAQLLSKEVTNGWGAYVTEPSANTLYFLNLTQSDWYLSERPWLAVITPLSSENSRGPQHRLSILTPAFEKSRSERLPFAIDKQQDISWVTWEESENPYEVLVQHLAGLRGQGEWSIQIEENVRQFVATGIAQAAQDLKTQARVGLVELEVRELRMRKTEAELHIQRCVAKITLEALRAVRKHLRIGMTEKEGEALIVNALNAGGLTNIGAIVLFGENAALPHAAAGSRRLKRHEFALFDSDFTRTMLPDAEDGKTCQWPSVQARKIYTTVQRAQRAALDKLETRGEGDVVRASEVDQAARQVIREQGWDQYFTHRLGHGIGIEVHEHPFLNSGNTKQQLQPGETFSNEPGIYIEGSIGVRLEDMVLKTENGWELISGSDLARSPCDP